MDVLVEIWHYKMTYFEALSFVFNLICVYFNTKEKVWAWPIGILGIVFFMILAYHSKLYSDVGLQVFFLMSSFYGWYQWLYGGEKRSELVVTYATRAWWLVTVVVVATCYPLLGWITDAYTNTDVPYWDAFPVVLSIIGQIMLAKKIIENWYIWIAADLVYVALFMYKSLYLMALLYGIFIVLCILGLIEWRKSWAESQAKVTPRA